MTQPVQVFSGAVLRCKHGSEIDVLLKEPKRFVHINKPVKMTKYDNILGVNLHSFGLCSSANHVKALSGAKKVECTAQFRTKWQNADGENNTNNLTTSACLQCIHGGSEKDLTILEDGKLYAKISQGFEAVNYNNYTKNRKLEFSKECINGQGSHPSASKIKLGKFSGHYNGCGWIATYNALILLGNNEVHPALIAKYYEKKLFLFGIFGLSPHHVLKFFKAFGYVAKKKSVWGFSLKKPSIDEELSKSGISIIEYWVNGGPHLHYVAVQKIESGFIIYNENNNQKFPVAHSSIDAWQKRTNNKVLNIILLLPKENTSTLYQLKLEIYPRSIFCMARRRIEQYCTYCD